MTAIERRAIGTAVWVPVRIVTARSYTAPGYDVFVEPESAGADYRANCTVFTTGPVIVRFAQ